MRVDLRLQTGVFLGFLFAMSVAAMSQTKLSQAHVIRMALSAGLPAVVGRFQAPRPEGYFASDYPMPKERMELEAAMAKVKVPPQR